MSFCEYFVVKLPFCKEFESTMTLHQHHGVSNHRHFDCLFNSFRLTTQTKIKALLSWPFPGDPPGTGGSPHREPVMRISLQYHDVFMVFFNNTWKRCVFYGMCCSDCLYKMTLTIEICPVSYMMTSSIGKFYRVTGPLCGEFTGHRWIPHTKASDVELWCFLWSTPEQVVE